MVYWNLTDLGPAGVGAGVGVGVGAGFGVGAGCAQAGIRNANNRTKLITIIVQFLFFTIPPFSPHPMRRHDLIKCLFSYKLTDQCLLSWKILWEIMLGY